MRNGRLRFIDATGIPCTLYLPMYKAENSCNCITVSRPPSFSSLETFSSELATGVFLYLLLLLSTVCVACVSYSKGYEQDTECNCKNGSVAFVRMGTV